MKQIVIEVLVIVAFTISAYIVASKQLSRSLNKKLSVRLLWKSYICYILCNSISNIFGERNRVGRRRYQHWASGCPKPSVEAVKDENFYTVRIPVSSASYIGFHPRITIVYHPPSVAPYHPPIRSIPFCGIWNHPLIASSTITPLSDNASQIIAWMSNGAPMRPH